MESEQEEQHKMMPQSDFSEPMQEQAGQTSGRYDGNQAYSQQHYESPYEHSLREGSSGKVHATPQDNKNLLRFALAIIAMLMLLAFAALCLVFIGGTGGWISFCAASLAIFLIAAVGIGTIK